MGKKYSLIEIDSVDSGFCPDDEYCILDESPFDRYLFEAAIENDRTDITDFDEFMENVEIYKRLKEAQYFETEKVHIDFSGYSEDITIEEAKIITDAMDKKVSDVAELLETAREILKNQPERIGGIVVYTCITGGYDNLIKPSFITPGVDYVCFTDNKDLKSNIWKIRPIPDELLGYSKVKQQRAVKILPHRYLSEYDVSIWIDANVDTKSDLKKYLDTLDFTKYSVFIPEHPARKCIYKEKDECVKIRKITGDGIDLANKQMKRYRDAGFPENNGLVQSNIVIRRHNEEYSKKIMELWWSELRDYSHRDQLSFNYALWKIGKEHFKALPKTTCNSKVFNWARAHKKK